MPTGPFSAFATFQLQQVMKQPPPPPPPPLAPFAATSSSPAPEDGRDQFCRFSSLNATEMIELNLDRGRFCRIRIIGSMVHPRPRHNTTHRFPKKPAILWQDLNT